MAILLVVLYHCRVITGGFVGVDVFFVISGYLITTQLVRELERHGRISLRGFYARRARRILPAATVTTIFTALMAGLFLSPLPAQQAFSDERAAALFGANFHFAALHDGYFNASLTPSPVEHYWSLSVEEQFYLVWPLVLLVSAAVVVWFLRRHAASREPSRRAVSETPRLGPVAVLLAAIAAASFAYSFAMTRSDAIQSYYSPLTRGWELAVGALIAIALPARKRLHPQAASVMAWLGVAGIVVAGLSFSDATPFPGDAALLPVLGAAAVIIGGSYVTRSWSAKSILGTPPFQRVGDWSYSWYLWHWPVLILVPAMLGNPLYTDSLPRTEALMLAGLSLVLAALSYALIERPTRRLKVLVRRPSLGIGAGGVLVGTSVAAIAAAGLLVPTARGKVVHPPSRNVTPALLSQYLREGVKTKAAPSNLVPKLNQAQNDIPVVSANGCLLLDAGTKSHGCVYGDKSGSRTVVLFGDSHAAAWFTAVNAVSKQNHWRLVFMGKAGCPVADVLVTRHNAPYNTCVTWRNNTLKQIAAMDPAMVIATSSEYVGSARPVAGVPTGHGSTWLDGVAASFNDLSHSAQHVVYIADVPQLQQPGAICVSNHLSNVRPCTVARSQAFKWPQVRQTEMRMARSDHVGVVDPENWFCTPTRCPVIVRNILVYRDAQHMIPQWSKFLAPVLGDQLVGMMNASPGATPAASKATSPSS